MFYYPLGTVDTGGAAGWRAVESPAASSRTHEWVGSEGSSAGPLFRQQILLQFPLDDSELPWPYTGRCVCFLLALFTFRCTAELRGRSSALWPLGDVAQSSLTHTHARRSPGFD